MAKKDRVPTPPKKTVQAPKAYKPEGDPRRTRLIFIGLAVAIIVAVAALGIGFVMSGDDTKTSGAIGDGDCALQSFPPLERGHIEGLPGGKLPEGYEYNSVPATSGLHSGQTAIWNLYDQPVPQIHYVHNMEHGGVVVQYGSEIQPEAVNEIRTWYAKDPRGLIVAPLGEAMEKEDPTLANRIVLTSWTHMMRCPAFDEGAFDTFSEDYRGDAPEAELFPLDSLQPGAN